jgi:hypothetical protein
MWTRTFWKSTAERVIGTAAAAAIPTFVGTSVWGIDYQVALGITASASAVTFLKCIVAATIGDKGTPSMVEGGV